MAFDGFTGRVTVPDSSTLNFGPNRDFSIEAWIRVNPGSAKDPMTILTSATLPPLSMVCLSEVPWVTRCSWWGAAGLPTGPSPVTGVWSLEFHRTGSRSSRWAVPPRGGDDPTQRHQQRQTVRRRTGPGIFSPTDQPGDLSNTEPARIGNHATPGYDLFFDGSIDEVSLYARALSESEVQAIFTAGAAGSSWPPGRQPIHGFQRSQARALPVYHDGPATTASFNAPNGGFVGPDQAAFVADTFNHAIRRVDLASHQVTTIAGNGTAGDADGPADTARFNAPLGTFVDREGTIFVADTGNNRIRKISTDRPRQVGTLAGRGLRGYVDGPVAEAQFDFPNSLAMDAFGPCAREFNNHTIRRTSQGVVSTFVGNGAPGCRRHWGQGRAKPAGGLAIDSAGNLFVTEWGSRRLRKVTPAGEVTTFASNIFQDCSMALG